MATMNTYTVNPSDRSSDSSSDVDSPSSDTFKSDFFVDSTISRDETQSKDAKEQRMLEDLAQNTNPRETLELNSSRGSQGMQLANMAHIDLPDVRSPSPLPRAGRAIPMRGNSLHRGAGSLPMVRDPSRRPGTGSSLSPATTLPGPRRPSAAMPVVPRHSVPRPGTTWNRPPSMRGAYPSPPPPRMMPHQYAPRYKANRGAEWRQKRLQYQGTEEGPSSAQSQTTTDRCHDGSDKKASAVVDLGPADSLDGDDLKGNASDKASEAGVPGTPGTSSPSDKSLPPNLGLAGSLGYVAEKHFGLNVLSQSSDDAQFTGFLLDTIELLEKRIQFLCASNDDLVSESGSEDEGKPEEQPGAPQRSQVLHQIICQSERHEHNGLIYEDEPTYSSNRLFAGKALTGKVLVPNLGKYYTTHPTVCFLVLKEHRCGAEGPQGQNHAQNPWLPNLTLSERLERLRIISPVLRKALEQVAQFSLHNENWDHGEGDPGKDMIAPYNFLFHHRRQLAALSEESSTYRPVLTPLLAFLNTNYEKEYESAEALFQRGMVSTLHFSKLFRPNQMVISKSGRGGAVGAYVLTRSPALEDKKNSVQLEGWSWRYNGSELLRKSWTRTIDSISDNEVPITTLDVHPVEFARQSDIEELENRGRRFWDHKAQVFVSYTGWDQKNEHCYNEDRFMVDVRTYQRMHGDKDYGIHRSRNASRFDIWPTTLKQEEILSKELMMLLPATTYGFNIQQKKWVILKVENIHPIKWNSKAFDRLVLEEKTKQLIRALVDVQTTAGKMDDIITGKGNGLIVLLHGSPGTGKTLTAESVAETSKKPLYRVTCGDIGTEPQEVEKYLQTVMYLGKIWDCVLLLDEADVFLEERTMQDLQRNSLVSVFLRVLEYHEGILILTSNRVGTFDEAFKSRIQVAIHYGSLTKRSRRQIWQNFFEMMEDANEDANMFELKRQLDELAAEEMNGRQIRNALLTARQLAMHCKERLDWEHLGIAMKTSSDFNKYLKTIKGQDDEEWAREESLR